MSENKPTVIYADDSIDALQLASVVAGKDPRFDLQLVTTGEGLLYWIEKKEYAGALIDLNLGETMTGTILAAKVRELYPKMPIVIYTAYDVDRVQKLINRNELETGVTKIWSKPDLEIDTLSDRIADLINIQ